MQICLQRKQKELFSMLLKKRTEENYITLYETTAQKYPFV